jgi:phosphate transport system substrate-binding protein
MDGLYSLGRGAAHHSGSAPDEKTLGDRLVNALSRKLIGAVVFGAVSLTAAGAQAADISGAGSTFAYPILSKWAEAYKAKAGVGMNYQSIGSGGGIKQINAKTVDFGATDMPLEQKDLDGPGLAQFPFIMGGIVPVINVKGIEAGKLKLTGKVLAEIYLGTITNWNDKEIVALNPGLKLPDLAIAPVYRSDGSGTTFNFTYYLAEELPEWKDKIGVNTAVQFPSGIGGKGNEGVSAFTSRTDGAIGYVEYAYAKQNKLAYALVQNKDGAYPEPNLKSFQAAAANADWAHAEGFRVILANQPGKDSWPMTASTWALVYKNQDKADIGKAVLSFFDYAYKSGQPASESLDYVSMPDNVVKLIEASWAKDIKGDGKALWQ